MTDPDLADATYIELLTPEIVEEILIKEKAGSDSADLGRPDGALEPRRGVGRARHPR